ncbi:MAG: lysophospholipid acyltransferase family protein [Pseudomonadota bacterium]
MRAGFYMRRAWVGLWYRLLFARLSGQAEITRANVEKVFASEGRAKRWWRLTRIKRAQGRFFGEVLNFERLLELCPPPVIEGAGREAFFDAVAAKRPVILLTGHIGNYALGLHFLKQKGVDAGFLYRTRGNVLLDSRFDGMLRLTGQRGFKIGHRAQGGYEGKLKDFIEFLGEGHVAVMLGDHRDRSGEKIRFLGRRAPTSLTPAKLARAHDALLIPCFILREGGGVRFRAVLDAPIPHKGSLRSMMRVFNDRMTQIIQDDPTQWSWTIRRW